MTACKAVPSGGVVGVSGGVGGVLSVGVGGEVVRNYNSGTTSVFGYGGAQAGWNGGGSASAYTGVVYGLTDDNSNYAGGFTGFNAGAGIGIFGASSSQGLSGGGRGLVPHPKQVTAVGASMGISAVGLVTGGLTATNYTAPKQLRRFAGWALRDFAFYFLKQACK
jgi:hypothetical protein